MDMSGKLLYIVEVQATGVQFVILIPERKNNYPQKCAILRGALLGFRFKSFYQRESYLAL